MALPTPELLHLIPVRGGLLSSQAAAPASKEAIDALKGVAREGCGGQECAICLDASEEEKAAAAGWKEMPCGHRFHGVCLEKWLRVHGSCPMCRHQLMPLEDSAEQLAGDESATAMGVMIMMDMLNEMIARPGFDGDEDEMARISYSLYRLDSHMSSLLSLLGGEIYDDY